MMKVMWASPALSSSLRVLFSRDLSNLEGLNSGDDAPVIGERLEGYGYAGLVLAELEGPRADGILSGLFLADRFDVRLRVDRELRRHLGEIGSEAGVGIGPGDAELVLVDGLESPLGEDGG